MASEHNRCSWLKTFLKPLNSNNWNPTPSTRTAKTSHCSFDVDPLVRKFSSRLHENYEENLEEKRCKLSLAKRSLIDIICIPPGPFPLLPLSFDTPFDIKEKWFEELERRWKLYGEASNIKSDREKSGSIWTIEMLECYIEWEDIAFVNLESRFDLTGVQIEQICERVDVAIKAVCGPDGTVENLDKLHVQPNSTESDTRMILDAILQPLCVYQGLTLRSEQTIKSKYLPSNRYDYIMYCDVDKPIGVVEAKRQGYLKDDSVAQLLLQLLLLSSEQPNWFYFGVLSDAHQFIFTGVSKQKVIFFQTNENQLEITTVKSCHDVASIVHKISWLISRAIQSRKYNPIEDLLAPVAAFRIGSLSNDDDTSEDDA